MLFKHARNLFLSLVFGLVLISCNDNIYEPKSNDFDSVPVPVETPYLAPPQIYIPIDFNRNMCGTTIMDTIISEVPDSWYATFTTSTGDSEKITLGAILGTFKDGYTGYSNELKFFITNTNPIKNNNILEINESIEKITVTYNSFNNNKLYKYSVILANSEIFYPQRWIDRVP